MTMTIKSKSTSADRRLIAYMASRKMVNLTPDKAALILADVPASTAYRAFRRVSDYAEARGFGGRSYDRGRVKLTLVSKFAKADVVNFYRWN